MIIKPIADLKHQSVTEIARIFEETLDFKEDAGAAVNGENPRYHPNPLLQPGNASYDKFEKTLQALPDDADLALVFHGTPKVENVQPICRDGLDPAKRNSQAYGPGEYFSPDMSVSKQYAREEGEVLVFVVVVPKDDSKTMPTSYMVVENNKHQLPIGSVAFHRPSILEQAALQIGIDEALQGPPTKRQRFDCCRSTAYAISTIHKSVTSLRPDEASELYLKWKGKLSVDDKIHITELLERSVVAEEIVPILFPDLPKRRITSH